MMRPVNVHSLMADARDSTLPLWAINLSSTFGVRNIQVKVWSLFPRTGEASKSGAIKNAGSAAFTPPGNQASGNDWVLVLVEAAKKYPRARRCTSKIAL